MRVSHRFKADSAVFDDDHLVSCAGLVPVMELAAQTGLITLLDSKIHIAEPGLGAGDSVPQAGTGYGDKFEEASEFGVPSGIGAPQYLKIGFTLKDFDIASRFTVKAIRNMTSQQVTHATQRVFEADNRAREYINPQAAL